MTDILDRKQLSDGIFFSRITDGRFKTNRISVTFYNDFSADRRSDYAILPYILTDSCRRYPNLTRLTEKYSDLYGASVSDNLGCSFDRRSMTFTISSIDDRYTLDGERLEEECCELLLDCILDPVLENGAFPAESVEMFTPSASRQSAVPHLLEAARLPCFATFSPAAAHTIAEIVETFMEFEPSPPVPTISSTSPP